MGWKVAPKRGLAWALVLSCALAACRGSALAPGRVAVREGEAELALGHPAQARDHFARALALDPESWRASQGWARAELEIGSPELALAQFVALAARNPGLFTPEQWRSACQALRESLEQGLEKVEPGRLLAQAESSPLRPHCQSPQIRDLLLRARRAEAERLRAAGDLAGALTQLGRVLAVLPGDPTATLSSLPLLVASGRRDEGLRLLSAALARRPDDPRLVAAGVALLVAR